MKDEGETWKMGKCERGRGRERMNGREETYM